MKKALFLALLLLTSPLAFAQVQVFPSAATAAPFDGGSATNPFLAPTGCGATPGFAFTDQTDMGMGRTSADNLCIQPLESGGANSNGHILLNDSQAAFRFEDGSGNVSTLLLTETGSGGTVGALTFTDELGSVFQIGNDGTTNIATSSFLFQGVDGTLDGGVTYGFTSAPEAGMFISGGTVVIQNQGVVPSGLSRSRGSFGSEFWSLSATHDTVETRAAFAQGSSEASAEMRVRIGATEDTSNETELYFDPDAISMRVEDTGVNEAQFALDEASTATFTLTSGANVSTTTFNETGTTFSDPVIIPANGSSTNMDLQFTGDPNTGIYYTGPDSMRMAVAGAEDYIGLSDSGAQGAVFEAGDSDGADWNLSVNGIAYVRGYDNAETDGHTRTTWDGPSATITHIVFDGTDTCTTTYTAFGIALCPVLFANLGTPTDGTIIYCSDCTKATPCAGSGTGALAKRLNSTWDCD